jgi:hypothetical protein
MSALGRYRGTGLLCCTFESQSKFPAGQARCCFSNRISERRRTPPWNITPIAVLQGSQSAGLPVTHRT